MTYTVTTANGTTQTAPNKIRAEVTARKLLGSARIYRGAEYRNEDGLMVLELWTTRAKATQESNTQADASIRWTPYA